MSNGQVEVGNLEVTVPLFTAGANGKVGTGNYPSWAIGSGFNPAIISAWPMNEGSGSTLFDVNTTTADNMVLTGGTPTWASNTGFPGKTLQFPASGVATTSQIAPTNFSGSTPFSIGLWVDETTQNPDNDILDTTASLSAPGIFFRRQTAGSQFYEFIMGGPYPTNSTYIRATTTHPAANSVYYVVITYNGVLATPVFQIYVNGVLQALTLINSALASPVNSTNPLVVKMNNGSAGTIAFLETDNTVLTQARISANYAAGPGIH